MTAAARKGVVVPRWMPNPASRAARRYWTAAMAAMLLAAAVIVATAQDGFTARSVELGMGSVWVSSQGPGQIALLDGASAAVTVRLKVADDGHEISAVQGDRAGYAVDRTTGTVTRIDAATWTATAAVPIDGAAAGLNATAAGTALYLTDIQRGLVVTADPDTLQPSGPPQSLSATRGAGTPIADTTGALWLLDATSGDLIRMTDTPQRTESGFSAGAASRLVLVQGAPVVVDLADRSASPIDPTTGHRDGSAACMDNDPADSTITVAGSPSDPSVFVVSGRDGMLRITDIAAGTCNEAISITTAGNDLGEPVAMSGRVFIPNRSTGQIIIVDLRTRQANVTKPVAQSGSELELLGQDGFVYYNDPVSNIAGVVRDDGSFTSIEKYNAANPDLDVFQQSQTSTETTTPPGNPANGQDPIGASPTDPPVVSSTATQETEDRPSPSPTPSTPDLPVPPTPSPTTVSPPPSQTLPRLTTPSQPPPPSVPSVQPSSSAESSSSPVDSSGPSSSVRSTEPPMRSVTIAVDGNGTIGDGGLGITCSNRCSFDIRDGTDVTLTATPGSDHEWIGWSGACSGTTPTCTVRVQDSITLGGTFARQTVPLSVTIAGQGTVAAGTVVMCTAASTTPCTRTLSKGTPITLQATSDPGWKLTAWTGDCSGTGECTLPMSGSQTVGATFARIPPGEAGSTQAWLYTITPTNTFIAPDGSLTSVARLSGRQTEYRSGESVYPNSTEQWFGCDGNTDQSVYQLPPGRYTTLSTTVALRDGVPIGLVGNLTFSAPGHAPRQVVVTKDTPIQIDYDVTGSASLTITAKTPSVCESATVGYGVFVDATLG